MARPMRWDLDKARHVKNAEPIKPDEPTPLWDPAYVARRSGPVKRFSAAERRALAASMRAR